MKKIHIQDVPRQTLEDVVLTIATGLAVCKGSLEDVVDAAEHKVLTGNEVRVRAGAIGLAFYDGVFRTFVHFGFLRKREEAEND